MHAQCSDIGVSRFFSFDENMFSSVYNSVYKLNALQKQSCYVYLATTVNLSMLIPQINNNNNKKHSAFEMLYEKIAQEYRLALHE